MDKKLEEILDRNMILAQKLLHLEIRDREWTNIKSGEKYEILLIGNSKADEDHKESHPVRVVYKHISKDDIWIVDLEYFLSRFE